MIIFLVFDRRLPRGKNKPKSLKLHGIENDIVKKIINGIFMENILVGSGEVRGQREE